VISKKVEVEVVTIELNLAGIGANKAAGGNSTSTSAAYGGRFKSSLGAIMLTLMSSLLIGVMTTTVC